MLGKITVVENNGDSKSGRNTKVFQDSCTILFRNSIMPKKTENKTFEPSEGAQIGCKTTSESHECQK